MRALFMEGEVVHPISGCPPPGVGLAIHTKDFRRGIPFDRRGLCEEKVSEFAGGG